MKAPFKLKYPQHFRLAAIYTPTPAFNNVIFYIQCMLLFVQ